MKTDVAPFIVLVLPNQSENHSLCVRILTAPLPRPCLVWYVMNIYIVLSETSHKAPNGSWQCGWCYNNKSLKLWGFWMWTEVPQCQSLHSFFFTCWTFIEDQIFMVTTVTQISEKVHCPACLFKSCCYVYLPLSKGEIRGTGKPKEIGPQGGVSLKSLASSIQDRLWLETLWRRPNFSLSSARWVVWLWHPRIGLQSPCGENHVKFVLGFPSCCSDSTGRWQGRGRCSCSRSFPSLTLRNWKPCNPHTACLPPGGQAPPAIPARASHGVLKRCAWSASCCLGGGARGLIFVAAFFFSRRGKNVKLTTKWTHWFLGSSRGWASWGWVACCRQAHATPHSPQPFAELPGVALIPAARVAPGKIRVLAQKGVI